MVQNARALIAWVSLAVAASGQATADLRPHAQVKAMARGVNILGYELRLEDQQLGETDPRCPYLQELKPVPALRRGLASPGETVL